MLTWASILSDLVKFANLVADWLRIERAQKIGEKLQELKNRREHDDRVKRARDARDRAQREFDELHDDDGVDGGGD
jgi:hypothetical protein